MTKELNVKIDNITDPSLNELILNKLCSTSDYEEFTKGFEKFLPFIIENDFYEKCQRLSVFVEVKNNIEIEEKKLEKEFKKSKMKL